VIDAVRVAIGVAQTDAGAAAGSVAVTVAVSECRESHVALQLVLQ